MRAHPIRRADSAPADTPTDGELIARILRGDPLAERALYDRHVDRVYRTAFRLAGDPDVAKDYTQDAFVRAFARLAQFRDQAAFGAWLRAIVVKVAYTGEKKRARFARTDDVATLVDRRAERIHTAADIALRVSRALDTLSPKLRGVFLLHDVEGYTHDEIAVALEIPSGTSKARLSAARAQLRDLLSDYAAGGRQ